MICCWCVSMRRCTVPQAEMSRHNGLLYQIATVSSMQRRRRRRQTYCRFIWMATGHIMLWAGVLMWPRLSLGRQSRQIQVRRDRRYTVRTSAWHCVLRVRGWAVMTGDRGHTLTSRRCCCCCASRTVHWWRVACVHGRTMVICWTRRPLS